MKHKLIKKKDIEYVVGEIHNNYIVGDIQIRYLPKTEPKTSVYWKTIRIDVILKEKELKEELESFNRERTSLNKELFNKIESLLDRVGCSRIEQSGTWHYGKVGLGVAIDMLLTEYDVVKKG